MQIASTCKGCTCDKCESLKENNPPEIVLNNVEKCQNTHPSRQRTFAKSRQSKTKIRYTYENHHRLDHTYAAAANFNDTSYSKSSAPVVELQLVKSYNKEPTNHCHNVLCTRKEKQVSTVETTHGGVYSNVNSQSRTDSSTNFLFGTTKDESDEISLKSTWLRNLCLEYQPLRNSSKSQSDVRSDGAIPEKHTCFHFSGINGTLKQYHRNRKVSKCKAEVKSTFLGNSKIIRSVQEDKKRWIAALALIELAQSK